MAGELKMYYTRRHFTFKSHKIAKIIKTEMNNFWRRAVRTKRERPLYYAPSFVCVFWAKVGAKFAAEIKSAVPPAAVIGAAE